MPERIPIAEAKSLAERRDLRQVIIVAWDGKSTHVVTYGKSLVECDQAAEGGNQVKRALNWPESLCSTQPSRVRRLQEEIHSLKTQLRALAEKGSKNEANHV